ncbi:MAG: PQQ-dependent sugar dehydrogenase [Calditrichia bacterium]|nr:PQQ-dependent sugar dehydrogenase [Calditrichia bacterium]
MKYFIFFQIIFLILSGTFLNAQIDLEIAFPNLSFTRPVDLRHAGDNSNRLFVIEQRGIISVFSNNLAVTDKSIFLNIENKVRDNGNEEGLLGLAFHPNYENNGYFFVDYTASNPRRTVISRYKVSTMNPDSALVDSEFVLLEINQPYSNHNGGQIAFGPDGYLYIAMGDGGSGGDPLNNGQDLTTLLGSILRIDVNSQQDTLKYAIPADNPFVGNFSGFREEIFAFGLRNPWRFSFDSISGKLWIADVGQNIYEEIDIIESGKNYGWRVMEGYHCYFPPSGCDTIGLTMPIWEYDHGEGQSVTGGYVYRGNEVPQLYGKYIYADYVSGKIWSIDYDGINPVSNNLLLDTSLLIASFGVDQNNEQYICSFDGKIYKIISLLSGNTSPDQESIPREFQLGQNYPNPFNSNTIIPFYIGKKSNVEISIYNSLGKHVDTLINKIYDPGQYTIEWNGKNNQNSVQASGIYFYKLKVDGKILFTRKLILIK